MSFFFIVVGLIKAATNDYFYDPCVDYLLI